MDQSAQTFDFGIVPRLRAVFFSVALVFIVVASIAMFQLRSLDATSTSLTNDTVPIFIRSAELERNLRNLLVLLQQVETLEDGTSILPLEHAIKAQIKQIRDHSGADEVKDDIGPPDNLSAALRKVESGAARILKAKKALLAHHTTLDRHVRELDVLRDAAYATLEELTFSETANAARDTLPGTQPDTARQNFHRDLIRANTVTELTVQTEAIIDAASALRYLNNASETDLSGSNLRFRIKGVVVLLGRLDSSPQRTELAQTLVLVRNRVLGQNGILQTAKLVQKETEVITRFIDAQIASIRVISELTDQWAAAARDNVDYAGAKLARTSHTLVLTMIISAAVAILIITASLVFIVERQINRRMAQLTKAVLAIAGGDTEHEVHVSGDDELGRMAEALTVFKVNAQELRRSNAELEKFAYVAAHDLRSPLRAIRDLSDWIIEDDENRFSEDSQSHMEMLRQRIERLNSLLSDLLEYSRVGKEHDDLTFVSVPVMIAELSGLLDPDGRFNITYSGVEHPVATYATPLRHILLNLLNNAIKHHDRSEGQISVRAQLSDARLNFEVEDDGPGIEPKYHDRVFALFQTLRPRDEVEGSGLGLAIIRKQLDHHGSKIRIQSDPALIRGTQFAFDLPELSETVTEPRQAA